MIVSAYDVAEHSHAMNRGAYDFSGQTGDFHTELTLNKTILNSKHQEGCARCEQQLTAIQHELSVAARIQHRYCPGSSAIPGHNEFEFTLNSSGPRSRRGLYDFF